MTSYEGVLESRQGERGQCRAVKNKEFGRAFCLCMEIETDGAWDS